ncbi:MAG: adenylosuccinate lyase [Mariprofundales bacterium]
MSHTSLQALCPLDGRYENKLASLRPIFSEYGLLRARVLVEVRWLEALSACEQLEEIPAISESGLQFLQNIIDKFDQDSAAAIKAIEMTTNHDVKAVEYWLRQQLETHPELLAHSQFLHFACTSEDINNLAHALMLADGIQTLLPVMDAIKNTLTTKAHEFADDAMLARTHGQAASPTTMGKELANIMYRLQRQQGRVISMPLPGKINGAVGNFNAHCVACPQVDWQDLTHKLVQQLGLQWNPYTTQIEPHDGMAELFQALSRYNTVLIDASRDIWGYISLGYFRQRVIAGEVGSSTMPHKVNPIDFENAEGNLGIANALAEHLSAKLPISRWQRDLSDSTVIRNVGMIFGYSLLAWQSFLRGMSKLEINRDILANDLDSSWEVLGEAVQTVMRLHGLENPYEKMKALTRGKRINEQALRIFIAELEIPDDAKQRLLAMTPADYTGLASDLAKALR